MYEIRFWGYLPNAPKRYIRLKAGVLPFPIGDSNVIVLLLSDVTPRATLVP